MKLPDCRPWVQDCKLPAGFTLVELLVAISVFSLVIALLLAGFRLANQGWDRSIVQGEKVERPRVVHGFVRRYLETAYPLEGDEGLVFSGGEKSLRFVSDMPAHLGEGGLYVIDLAVKEDEGKEKLLFSRTLAHPDLQEEAGDHETETTIVLENVQNISFAYFGAAEEDGEDEWQQLWEVKEWLPKLVRLGIRDGEGQWIDLVVRIFSQSAGTNQKRNITDERYTDRDGI